MRTLIATLMASTFAMAGAAFAADAVEDIPQPPIAQDTPAPVSNWSGYYLGGAGDYNFGKFQGAGGGHTARGAGGDIYTGYNWQNGNIVYGIEGDVGYAGNDSRRNGIKGKHGFDGSVRGRLGYDLNRVMVYGTAGVAAGRNKMSDDTSSDSKTGVGYTVGAGAETMVSNNVTARMEYRFTDYGDKHFDLDSGDVKRGYDEHSIKVGLGVKF